MKNQFVLLLFSLVIISGGCKREKPSPIIEGQVLDRTDQNKIPNAKLLVYRLIDAQIWGPSSRYSTDTIISDDEGFFQLSRGDYPGKVCASAALYYNGCPAETFSFEPSTDKISVLLNPKAWINITAKNDSTIGSGNEDHVLLHKPLLPPYTEETVLDGAQTIAFSGLVDGNATLEIEYSIVNYDGSSERFISEIFIPKHQTLYHVIEF